MLHLKKRYELFLKNNNTFGNNQCRVFLNLLDGDNYQRILEVGCGNGFFTYLTDKEKKNTDCQYFGADVFDDCSKYKAELPDGFIFKKIGEDGILPFPNNYFDLVISMDVIEHVFDDKKFVSEQLRVLKSGGEIILGTPNYYRPPNILLLIMGKLKYPRKLGVDSYGDIIHLREYKKSQLEKLLGLFKGKIVNLKIIPIWIGIDFLRLGFRLAPKILHNICQFWIIKFKKL